MAEQFQYLDLAGLQKFKELSDATYVAKVEGKELSDNNFDDAAVAKLEGIAAGAQVNVVETVKVNGEALVVTDKAVDVIVPTKTSEILNDSGFITSGDIPEGAAASTLIPKAPVDGGSVGTDMAFARGDHAHPHDDTKVDKTITVNGQALSANVELDYEDVGAAPEVHEHDVATDATNGFMSAADKAKLDGIAEGANAYVLPAATADELGGVTVGDNITVAAGEISLVKANVTNALGYVPMTTEEINSAIAAAVAAADHLKREIVDALPTENIDVRTIYMLVEDEEGTGNIYGEYMWINEAWEKLGSTAADFKNYTQVTDFGSITDEEIEALFA